MESKLCDRPPRDESDRKSGRYSLEELAGIAQTSPRRVRSWIRAGLIELPDDEQPTFGFDDVRLVNLLVKLADSGFGTARLRGVLNQLRRRFPNPHDALAQLDLFAGILMIRDADSRLTAPDGQMLFDLSNPSDSISTIALRLAASDDLFARAVSLEQSGELEEAALAYRALLRQEGPDPATCFNLANVLASLGQSEAAVERYRQAIELEPENAAAWNNLGLSLADLGESDEALNAWRRAIEIDPHFLEAIFNLADALEDAGCFAESRPLWESYLRHDTESDWASYARRCLDGKAKTVRRPASGVRRRK
jgi:tetratricopeptide (TPR) repeat protein